MKVVKNVFPICFHFSSEYITYSLRTSSSSATLLTSARNLTRYSTKFFHPDTDQPQVYFLCRVSRLSHSTRSSSLTSVGRLLTSDVFDCCKHLNWVRSLFLQIVFHYWMLKKTCCSLFAVNATKWIIRPRNQTHRRHWIHHRGHNSYPMQSESVRRSWKRTIVTRSRIWKRRKRNSMLPTMIRAIRLGYGENRSWEHFIGI